jgi:hypothetical protein
MTREEFIKVLEEKVYSYEIEGDKIVVTYRGEVQLNSLTSIPSDLMFKNIASVWLNSLKYLPSGVVFGNGTSVSLNSLTSIPSDVVFSNGWIVSFHRLTSIPPGVEFKNGGGINLKSIMNGYFGSWKGNIEGIYGTRLLNLMIKQGLFER